MADVNKIKQALVGGLCAVMLLTIAPQAHASSTNNQEILRLYQIIAQLQLQLLALQQRGGSAPVATDRADVDVTTGSASQDNNDTIKLSGNLDFSGERRANVWFEYGKNFSLSYSTPSLTLTRSGSDAKSFNILADDIDFNTTYYYRAVAEDDDGDFAEGVVRTFKLSGSSNNDDDDDNKNDEDVPSVNTDSADDITDNSAKLRGEVDMQDVDNGYVFFIYGEDEDMVDEAADEDSYGDIDTDGDNLRKVVVDSSFDGDDDFSETVTGLDDDTEFFFRLCVEYEDEDGDDALECGDVENFETDRN